MSIINGIVGTIFALWLYNNFVGWLTFLSLAIPPVGGVIIADFFANRKRYKDFAKAEFQTVKLGWHYRGSNRRSRRSLPSWASFL